VEEAQGDLELVEPEVPKDVAADSVMDEGEAVDVHPEEQEAPVVTQLQELLLSQQVFVGSHTRLMRTLNRTG
jgi:hypothetical protein